MRRRQRRERHRGAAPDPGGGNNSPRPPCFALRRCRAAGFGGRPCAWFQKKAREGRRVFKAGSLGRRFSGCLRSADVCCRTRLRRPTDVSAQRKHRCCRKRFPDCREKASLMFSREKACFCFKLFSRENDVFSACFAAGNFCLPRNDVYQCSKNAADHQAARQTSLGMRIYFRRQARRMSCKPCLPYGVSGAEGPARLIKRKRGRGKETPF